MGTVTVEGVGPIADVTVTIQGEGETVHDVTDNMGAYAFTGLHAGDYSVVISGFDDDEYGFPDGTSATVTVELQETGNVPFDGIMLRTAAIEGTVTVGDDDVPLSGVMVTVNGGPERRGALDDDEQRRHVHGRGPARRRLLGVDLPGTTPGSTASTRRPSRWTWACARRRKWPSRATCCARPA